MSTEEANSLYKCTVRDFHALHKWDAGGTPSQAMELQEMGVDGQGSRETGGSSADRIFFMKYPLPFLQHWYATYPPPQQDTTTTGSSVVSPSSVVDPVDTTAAGAQLRLRSDIVDFNVFPYSEKTGDNVKSWFLQVLNQNQIKHSMVSGITPDGAADGQCGLRLIDTLRDKVDTCMLHQLQRAVLWCL
jgi:hypothetical protein